MRIVLLSPHFKPFPGGVADYTYELALQFHRQGHEVVVVTSTKGPFPEGPFKILTVPNWGLWQAFKIKRVLSSLKADNHYIQWTPLAFGPKTYGIAPGLVMLLFLMARLKKVLMVHESHYPVLPDLRGLMIGLPHFFQFVKMVFFVALSGDKIVFSHKANENKWRKFLPFGFIQNKMTTISVFSNIPVAEDCERPEDKTVRLGYFGGLHPTNDINLVRKAFDYCLEKSGFSVSLKVMGVKKDNCPQAFRGEEIEVLGHLNEEELSCALQSLDILVIPFTDGVSTRRGTLMAGLSHKIAVATTESYNTVSDVPWSDIVGLASHENPKEFCTLVLGLVEDEGLRQKVATNGHDYYLKHFSSDVCTQKFLKL